jgi:hypothetical protein
VLSPTNLLALQGQTPTADREAIRLLARLEADGPRRGGAIEIRAEDASDLLPLLKGRAGRSSKRALRRKGGG